MMVRLAGKRVYWISTGMYPYELAEEIKWGQPCYAYNGKNVVLIHGFKDYCAILFIKARC